MTSPDLPLTVAVVGASGYAGGELLRLLLAHPGVRVALAAAPSGTGQALHAAHPSLRGLTDLPLSPLPDGPSDPLWPRGLACVYLCLPHGASRAFVERLPPGVRVVDLGGDFRLRDPELARRWYGVEPLPAGADVRFVYGLPELNRHLIAGATHVASPGCFATACILALAPLARHGLVEPRIVVDAVTGSTGAGAKPSATTHHPERAASFFAYKAFKHQHLPEINQALADVAPSWPGDLLLQTHAAPLVRGIFASVYARLRPGTSAGAVAAAFRGDYEGQPFIRLGEGSPNVGWSRGGNFADLGWESDGRDLCVFVGLDNLGKGAAGQAVQNMNLMFGLPETSGLWRAGGVP